MKHPIENITPIVRHDLCTQCGTCLPVCPVNAISFRQHPKRGLIPVVDETVCIQCRKCVKVCPGDTLDFKAMQKQVFGSLPEDPLFGHYQAVYSGYSNEEKVRYNGASGGLVSTLLIDLLENKQIDGALVVKMGGKQPLEPHIFIARTKEEILSAQQSKYIPVPINIGFKEILENPDKKYAVVSLPCHLHGITLLERLYPKLKEQVVLKIGLLCGYNPTVNSTKFLLDRAGVKDYSQVKEIKYRDGDWPCGFRAVMKDGTDHFLYPIKEFLYSHYIFERQRCAMCRDHSAEFSDLSFGDEWRHDIKTSAGGWSFLIVRSGRGKAVIDSMAARGKITLEKAAAGTILRGQAGTLYFKKYGSFAFARIRKLFFKKAPGYLNRPEVAISPRYYVSALIIYVVTTLFNTTLFRKLAVVIPTYVFTKYRWFLCKAFEKKP